MISNIYHIQNLHLRNFLPYLLFNEKKGEGDSQVTYFPNHDICLCIVYEKKLEREGGAFRLAPSGKAVNSYLSGLYLRPHCLQANGGMDEICLPFTPYGFQALFRQPANDYWLGEDVIYSLFGERGKAFFESLYGCKHWFQRGALIENFLVSTIEVEEQLFIKGALFYLEKGESVTLPFLAKELRCSEVTLQRKFKSCFGISPKQYQQLTRFRKALYLLHQKRYRSLTDLCYQVGFYDQSHFIRSFTSFTGRAPQKLLPCLSSIDDQVICWYQR